MAGNQRTNQHQPARAVSVDERTNGECPDAAPSSTIRDRLASIKYALKGTTETNLISKEIIQRQESVAECPKDTEKCAMPESIDDLLREIHFLANVSYEQAQSIRNQLG